MLFQVVRAAVAQQSVVNENRRARNERRLQRELRRAQRRKEREERRREARRTGSSPSPGREQTGKKHAAADDEVQECA